MGSCNDDVMVGGATKNASQGNCFIMSDMGYVIIMKKCLERCANLWNPKDKEYREYPGSGIKADLD